MDEKKPDLATPDPLRWRKLALPFLFVFAGAVLRLLWPLDFEWKGDEKWSFETAQRTARGDAPWPRVGMPTSVGFANPGLSIWQFAALGYVFRTPASMTQGVVLLNVLALVGFLLWVRFTWPEEDRLLGYWSIALFAVSPLPVLFARKLWPPNLYPVFLLPWLWSHSRRERPAGSFFWGLCGALLGQLNLSGFFVAAGLALATVITNRKNVRWIPWLSGSILGAVPLLSWLQHLAVTGAAVGGDRVVSMDFFWEGAKNAWGLGLEYSLGRDTAGFLAGPAIAGVSTGLMRWAHLALAGISLYGGVILWRDRASISVPPQLRVHFWSLLLGGALLTLACVRFNTHYLIVWSPFFHAAAVWILFRRPRLLLVATCLQLLVSACFLTYIHDHAGAPGGDYGVTYRAQMERERATRGE